MITIKFRGKRLDNGEWVYGSLLVWPDRDCYILSHEAGDLSFEMTKTQVDPSTVGQYTGFKEKNGKEIWEGDILGIRVNRSDQCKTFVRWDNEKGGFGIHAIGIIGNYNLQKYEIIGNIHDNPELLKLDEEEKKNCIS